MSLNKNQIISILAERQNRPYDIVFWKELSDMIDYWRASIIKQTIQKDSKLDIYFIQPLVITIAKTSIITCPIDYGCTMRSVDKIPTPLKNSNTLFHYVGSADFRSSYSPTYEHQLKFHKYRKYTGTDPLYIWRDDYFFFANINTDQKYVGIQGIFTDLEALKKLKCDGIACYSDDDPYPASEDVVQQIIQAILQTEFRQMIPETKVEVPVNQ